MKNSLTMLLKRTFASPKILVAALDESSILEKDFGNCDFGVVCSGPKAAGLFVFEDPENQKNQAIDFGLPAPSKIQQRGRSSRETGPPTGRNGLTAPLRRSDSPIRRSSADRANHARGESPQSLDCVARLQETRLTLKRTGACRGCTPFYALSTLQGAGSRSGADLSHQ
jgi:hypothetical protein